jgi:hypothetical protein
MVYDESFEQAVINTVFLALGTNVTNSKPHFPGQSNILLPPKVVGLKFDYPRAGFYFAPRGEL